MSLRIRLLRTQHGFSLEQLAGSTGLTRSYLSKVERGVSVPSIAVALRIAKALNVDVDVLFGVPVENDMVSVVRADARLRIAAGENNGRVVDMIAAEMTGKQMYPFVISPPAEFTDGPRLHEHPGEEFLFVLDGEIEIRFPERSEHLAQGDAVYFRAEIPHRIRRRGTAVATALVVISRYPADACKPDAIQADNFLALP